MRTDDKQRVVNGRFVDSAHQPVGPAASRSAYPGHDSMVIACCIPMLVIAVVLVATGLPIQGSCWLQSAARS